MGWRKPPVLNKGHDMTDDDTNTNNGFWDGGGLPYSEEDPEPTKKSWLSEPRNKVIVIVIAGLAFLWALSFIGIALTSDNDDDDSSKEDTAALLVNNDEAFWGLVHSELPDITRPRAEKIAEYACESFDESGVEEGIFAVFGFTSGKEEPEDVGYIVGVGVPVFCPQHEEALSKVVDDFG